MSLELDPELRAWAKSYGEPLARVLGYDNFEALDAQEQGMVITLFINARRDAERELLADIRWRLKGLLVL